MKNQTLVGECLFAWCLCLISSDNKYRYYSSKKENLKAYSALKCNGIIFGYSKSKIFVIFVLFSGVD